MSLTGPHDEFLELCAVSTSGHLSEAEQKRLREHLANCPSCREALKQFEAVVDRAIPAIGATELSESLESGPSWSQEQAEKDFWDRLAREEDGQAGKPENPNAISAPHRSLPFASDSTWRDVWVLCAAGILLFVTLSFYTYRVGVSRGTNAAKSGSPQRSAQGQPSLVEPQLSDAIHDRQIAGAQVERGDQTIADLRRQLAQQSVEINQMKAAQTRAENDLRAGDATRQDLIQQRTGLTQNLVASQISSQTHGKRN